MTCRAPTSSTTCAGGSPTGAQLSYNAEGWLDSWQNAPSSPSSTDAFLYDGEGNRVEQQSTTGLPGSPVTTSTAYIGNLEEVSTSGSTTTTTTYYYAGTQRIAVGVNVASTGSSAIAYLMTDALGSATVAVDGNGTVTAAQLYDPYGNGRYQSGAMPGSFGYTGQRSDALTGLNYDGARYYDPLASQFVSADTLLPGNGYDPWGLSRYAYVEGNPLIRTDPTGHDGGWLGGLVSAVTSTVSTVASAAAAAAPAVASAAWTALDYTTGIPSMIGDVQTIFSGNTSFLDKVMAVGDIALNVTMDVGMVVGVGEGMRAAYIGAKVAAHVAEDVGEHALEHAGEDAVEHVAEHEAEDMAEKTAARLIRVAADTGEHEPAQVVRLIQKGEKFGDIMDEVKTGLYETGREHAVVVLQNGERALVRGGRYGIDFEEGSIRRILFHTHPWDDLARGPSPADFSALEQLGQGSSHVYEHGSWTKFWNHAMFR